MNDINKMNEMEGLLSDLKITEKCWIIPIRSRPGMFTLIDEDMYHIIKNKSVFLNDYGYVKFWKDGKTVYLAREIMKEAGYDIEGFQVDHRNRIPLDNRLCNLRLSNFSGNNFNRNKLKDCTSKYKGVCFDKSRNKWKARVTENGKQKCIGRYNTEEAKEAYDNFVLTHPQREFVTTNEEDESKITIPEFISKVAELFNKLLLESK